jgi:hypothetical protein
VLSIGRVYKELKQQFLVKFFFRLFQFETKTGLLAEFYGFLFENSFLQNLKPLINVAPHSISLPHKKFDTETRTRKQMVQTFKSMPF